MTSAVQRLPAEQRYAEELAALLTADQGPRPGGWRLSPRAVRSFVLGDGDRISRKIEGNDALVERAIVTLSGGRGLLLAGEPGTAKSLLSELLAAAISGCSTLTVQGGAGVVEEHIRYGWNYALLLRDGPNQKALVPGPLYAAMAGGQLLRFEEITRCATEVQDCLIPVLSDRILHLPELKDEQDAWLLSRPGFNVIATANLRDRGVNEMSAALKRRFNFELMQALGRREQAALIAREARRQLDEQAIEVELPGEVIELLATVFDELKRGEAAGVAVERPATALSTAEAIGVVCNAASHCWYFGSSRLMPRHLGQFVAGAVVQGEAGDAERFAAYLRLLRQQRAGLAEWQDFLDGC
ncbi:ATP-binding protein [Chitinimonas lacunae]|uniref:AAA family ATPase n=1 Tax=Chitinimonas lacunae TaxID=1963018 RepID=A0ABV8MPR9_9NEIS